MGTKPSDPSLGKQSSNLSLRMLLVALAVLPAAVLWAMWVTPGSGSTPQAVTDLSAPDLPGQTALQEAEQHPADLVFTDESFSEQPQEETQEPMMAAAAAARDDTDMPAAEHQLDSDSTYSANDHSDSIAELPGGESEGLVGALVQWAEQHGAEVNVDIKWAGESEGFTTYAKKDFEQGDVFLRLPVELAYVVDYDLHGGVEGAAAQLALDMARNDIFWTPMLRALPKHDQVLNLVKFPKPYLSPIIQDNNTVMAIEFIQEMTDLYCQLWQPYYEDLGLNVTPADCQHAVALVLTGVFHYGGKNVIVPVLDFANHENSCLHTHAIEPCDSEEGYRQWSQGLPSPEPTNIGCGVNDPETGHATSSNSWCTASQQQGSHDVSQYGGMCIVWRAAHHVSSGQHVCNNYGTLLQDRTLLQYGFLQAGPVAQELSMMDRPEHSDKFDEVWDKLPTPWGQAVPDKFTGTPAEMRQEAARLKVRLDELTAGDQAAAAVVPDDASDPDGNILSLLWEWRRQRLDAIAAEIQRLDAAVEGLGVEGFDVEGVVMDELGVEGVDMQGLGVGELDLEGLDVEGLGVGGLREEGLGVEGLGFEGLDWEGLYVEGLGVEGLGEEGLDVEGLDVEGLDGEGLGMEGLDGEGLGVEGLDDAE